MDKNILRYIAFAELVLTLMPSPPVKAASPALQKGMEDLRTACRVECEKAIKDGEDSGNCPPHGCMSTWKEHYNYCEGCGKCPPDYSPPA